METIDEKYDSIARWYIALRTKLDMSDAEARADMRTSLNLSDEEISRAFWRWFDGTLSRAA